MLRCALAAVPMACAVLLSSCYGDEYGDCPATGGDAVPVKVNVSAGVIGDLNGSRAGGDVNAEEHEFINTLYVYIVKDDNGTPRVYDNISPNLTTDASAQGGNLTSWTSETFTLDPGKYTFYAFANIDKYVGEYGSAGSTTQKTGKELLDACFGATSGEPHPQFRNGDLADFRLYDPASKVNIEAGKYIPMSAVASITVSGDLNASGGIIVDLPLERLVSKVRMTVGDGATLSSNASVTFFGCSQNVPLMAASTDISRGSREASATKSFEDGSRQIEFYVNETPTGDPFTVTLNTGNTTGVSTYQATTELYNIPRNSIYPLTLTFDGEGIQLTPTAYLQVTGMPAYTVTYAVAYDMDTYIFGITYGSYLVITPSVNGAQGTPLFTWSEVTGNPDGMGTITGDVQPPTLTANSLGRQFTGDASIDGYEYRLQLRAQWTEADGYGQVHDYDRTYNVIVKISQDYDKVLNGITDKLSLSSAGTRGAVTTLSPERLNMVKVK